MIHFLQVTPISCISPSGRTISHTTQVSYVTGVPVKNIDTGRTTHRQHADGTAIIYRDIVSYNENKYTDRNKTLEENLASMSSDVYNARKQKNENVWYEIENALPNHFQDEQLREIAHKIGIELSRKYHRPIIVGVHKKDGNNHLHILAPGRELSPDGEWKNKRRKIYKDKKGELIYDKVYRDTHGHDIRMPIVPKGEQPIYDKNGVCINQVKKAGRRQWACNTHVGDAFSKQALPQLHDEIDKIHNAYFKEHGIDDRVVRISPEVRVILQRLKLKQLHYGKRASDAWKQRVVENNRRYRIVADYIASNLAQIKQNKITNDLIVQAEQENASKLQRLIKRNEQLQSELAEMENSNIISEYVEQTLKPETVFVSHEVKKVKAFASEKEDICNKLMKATASAWRLNNTAIEALQAESSSPRNDAKLALWTTNNKTIARLYSKIKEYANNDMLDKAKAHAKAIWRGLSGWQRYKAIKSIKGSRSATIYKDYLMLSGEPEGITVPSLPSPDIQSIKQALPDVLQAWKRDMASESRIPPADVSILRNLASAEMSITGESVDTPIPLKYEQHNLTTIDTYNRTVQTIQESEQEEAKRLLEERKAEIERQQLAEKKRQEEIRKQESVAASLSRDKSVATSIPHDASVAAWVALYGSSVAAFLHSVQASTGYDESTYKRLSDLRAVNKNTIMEAIADAQINANATDYDKARIVKYLSSHSTVMQNEAKKYHISTTAYDTIAAIAKGYWQRSPKYQEAQKKKQSAKKIPSRQSGKEF